MTQGPAPLVLHVLPRDLARGAQVFARTLRDRLDGAEVRHRTLTLFHGPEGALAPDHKLDLAPGVMRRAGFDPLVLRPLRQRLAELAPDVVVAHGGEPLKYCASARPAGTPLIYYKVGSSRALAQRPSRARWHRWLIGRADHVVCISEELAAEARDVFGVERRHVSVIPNGRDPGRYRPADHTTGPPTLIFVGHLEPPKRPAWFVEVVRRVSVHQPDLRAVMVGDGPLLDELSAATVGLPVELTGRRDDVADLLADAHVLVSSSEREGMPGVLIEAGLAGLPVVTTTVAGVRDVVEEGVTGVTVGRDDLDMLAVEAGRLLADPARRATLGAAARRRCVEHFSLDAVARSWGDVLGALPAGRRVS